MVHFAHSRLALDRCSLHLIPVLASLLDKVDCQTQLHRLPLVTPLIPVSTTEREQISVRDALIALGSENFIINAGIITVAIAEAVISPETPSEHSICSIHEVVRRCAEVSEHLLTGQGSRRWAFLAGSS